MKLYFLYCNLYVKFGMSVLLAVLNHLGEDLARDVGKRDSVVDAVVFNHVGYGLRLESHRLVDLERLAIGALQHDLLRRHVCEKTREEI